MQEEFKIVNAEDIEDELTIFNDEEQFEEYISTFITIPDLKKIIVNYLTVNNVCKLILEGKANNENDPTTFMSKFETLSGYCFVAKNESHGLLMVESLLKTKGKSLIDLLIIDYRYVSTIKDVVHISQETVIKILDNVYKYRLIKVKFTNEIINTNLIYGNEEQIDDEINKKFLRMSYRSKINKFDSNKPYDWSMINSYGDDKNWIMRGLYESIDK